MKIPTHQVVLKISAISLLFGLLTLQGCDSDDGSTHQYTVTITNLTSNQPFSPLTGLVHNNLFKAYSLGSPASSALELLAESGDNSDFINDASIAYRASGNGLVTPGGSETITLNGDDDNPQLSLLTMLVNTNDGFAGLKNIDLNQLAKGDTLSLYANVYDAGTEDNSEASDDVPGQSGEGFNAARNDRNFVSVHPGVVSQDDGLASSSLTSSHRFDNPVAKIVVTRIN